jgi:hypothetical protein
MLVDSATEDGVPADVTATQQAYRDALGAGLVAGVIGYTPDAQAAGFALYSWFLLPRSGEVGLEILELHTAPVLGAARGELDRALFSACCQVAAQRRAGAVEWRAAPANRGKAALADALGARPSGEAHYVLRGAGNVADIARITDQALPWLK